MNKIQFNVNRRVIDITLPSMPGSEIKMYQKPTIQEQRSLFKKYGTVTKPSLNEHFGYLVDLISLLIVESNFVDSEGKDIKLTSEHIDKMLDDDLSTILAAMEDKTLDEYKEDLKKGAQKTE
jgi:hypothetical protein